MNYDSNIYYNPEKHGLSVIAEVEYSSGSYEFDTRVVWKHDETGVFYTARDSGCSCPTPFEDYASIEALDRLDIEALEVEVRKGGNEWQHDLSPGDGMDFMAKIREAVWQANGGIHGNAPVT